MIYQILAILIWSSAFVAAKYAEAMLDPILLVEFRLMIAALFVLPTALKYAPRIPKDTWKPLTLLSFASYTGVLMLQFKGLQYTSASSAVTVIGLEPLIVVFLGHFFFGDRARWFHWLCGVLAFAGVMLLLAGEHGTHSEGKNSLLGFILVLAGSIVFAAVMRPTKKMMQQIPVPAFTALTIALAPLIAAPFALAFTQNWHIKWSLPGIAGILYLGIGCNWLGYWLWNKGMAHVPSNLSGLLIALEPLFGVLMAVLLLHEPLTAASAAGIALVVGATLLASAMQRKS